MRFLCLGYTLITRAEAATQDRHEFFEWLLSEQLELVSVSDRQERKELRKMGCAYLRTLKSQIFTNIRDEVARYLAQEQNQSFQFIVDHKPFIPFNKCYYPPTARNSPDRGVNRHESAFLAYMGSRPVVKGAWRGVLSYFNKETVDDWELDIFSALSATTKYISKPLAMYILQHGTPEANLKDFGTIPHNLTKFFYSQHCNTWTRRCGWCLNTLYVNTHNPVCFGGRRDFAGTGGANVLPDNLTFGVVNPNFPTF